MLHSARSVLHRAKAERAKLLSYPNNGSTLPEKQYCECDEGRETFLAACRTNDKEAGHKKALGLPF